MQLDQARSILNDLMPQLSSACVRLEVAGSVRRCKPDVGDLELVAIPNLGTYEVRDMFDQVVERHHVNHLENAINDLLAGGAWEFDAEVKRNGPKYKRLKHAASGICCDLFITDARRWGYTLTIRTGPSDFSKALVKLAHRRGMFFKDGLLHKHAPIFDEKGEVMPCPAGEGCIRIIPTPEEVDIFKALGMDYVEPKERQALVVR